MLMWLMWSNANVANLASPTVWLVKQDVVLMWSNANANVMLMLMWC
jgi:hypothetical protein